MKLKHCMKILFLLLCASLFLSTNGFALPMATDTITVYSGDNRPDWFAGGEFKLVDGDDEYISFCVEMNEHISLGSKYTVDSVADYADSGTDYLDDPTKWLVNEYFNFNGELQSLLKDESFSLEDLDVAVQLAIWLLEDEITSTQNSLANEIIGLATMYGANYSYDNVKVIT